MSEESPAATGAVGITDHELAALADLEPTVQAQRVLEAIGIGHLLRNRTAVRAGYSTLLVRDIAGLAGSEIVAQDFGAAVTTIMTTAEDILRLVITRDVRTVARTVFVEADLGSFLLDMTAFGVHAAQPLERHTSLIDLIAQVLTELVGSDDLELPLDVEVARFPLDSERRAAAFVIESAQSWRWPNHEAESPAAVWERVEDLLGRSDGDVARTPRRAF